MKKRRLGKGLASLIGGAGEPKKPREEAPEEAPEAKEPPGGAVEIELARIELNPRQPRKEMDEEALRGLADSIRSAGVLQPIVVREHGDMYELVMGERRLRASHLAGLAKIPAVVRQVDDDRMLELALIENVQREDLNPIEKAEAIRQMADELALTQEQVGAKLGLSRSAVTNFLRLLELPPEIRDMVSRGTLSAGHARAILRLEDAALRMRLARRITREGLSVRQAEGLAARGLEERTPTERGVSPQIKRLQTALRESLGTKVEIRARGKNGRIIIHFAGNDEFERLFELMTGTAQQIEESAA